MTMKLPSRSEGSNERSIHSSFPSAASRRISACACGATTRRSNASLEQAADLVQRNGAGTDQQATAAVELEKDGKKLMRWILNSATPCGTRPVGRSRSTGSQHFAGQMRAQFVIRMAREPLAQVLVVPAVGKILPQQTLDRFGHQRRRAAITNWARDICELAYRAAKAEVVGVRQLALVLDLLAFDADVRDPVLAAAIRASSHVQAELLIELRDPLLELADEPASKALGLGDGKLAELGAGAGDCATPEVGGFDVQADLAEFAHQFAGFGIGHVDKDQILRNRGPQLARPESVRRALPPLPVARRSGGRAVPSRPHSSGRPGAAG